MSEPTAEEMVKGLREKLAQRLVGAMAGGINNDETIGRIRDAVAEVLKEEKIEIYPGTAGGYRALGADIPDHVEDGWPARLSGHVGFSEGKISIGIELAPFPGVIVEGKF